MGYGLPAGARMLEFGWLSRAAWPPGRWDLRYEGWLIRRNNPAEQGKAPSWPILVDWRAGTRAELNMQPGMGRWMVAIGAQTAAERGRLMQSGFGEALPGGIGRHELAIRLTRVAQTAQSMRRQLQVGPVTLDLFHRDGRAGTRWLGLHPREFALFWRLAEAEGARVSRRALLADVWRLDHDPETNRIEVHISRLRAKLATFRLSWLIATDPRGGYRLHASGRRSAFAFGMRPASPYEARLAAPSGGGGLDRSAISERDNGNTIQWAGEGADFDHGR